MRKKDLSQDELFSEFTRWLKLNYDVDYSDIKSIISDKRLLIPIKIFNRKLSVLEAVVKYLREEQELKFSEMSITLNRDQIQLSTTYRNSLKKYSKHFTYARSEYDIPADVLQDRVLSPLECVVTYLKEEKQLRFIKIAEMLRRDQRTIWTAHNRGKKKRR